MAYTTINKSTDYFNTKLYTGNGSAGNAQTGVGFQPDWVWIKTRDTSNNHTIFDAVRGVTKRLRSNQDNAENTSSGVTSFDSDGFTVGSDSAGNTSGGTMVAWNWKAGGGQGSSNTDGTINTTYTSVNTTSGFSISKYTGTGSNATVGHGLGVVPKMIIVKCLDQTHWWFTYHVSIGNTKHVTLNTGNAESGASAAYWNNTTPTSSVFSIGTDTGVNQSGQDYIAYCFAEKTGFSKFGSYVGNGNADGSFIYTGFKPAFVMIKYASGGGSGNWTMYDSKRLGYNVSNSYIYANESNTESSVSHIIDLVSNGFKCRANSSDTNTNGGTMIYMAFAEAPLVGSNDIPANAR